MATREEILKFTAKELQDFLEKQFDLCEQTLESFSRNRVDGESFLELSEVDLRELVTPLGDRKKIQKLLSSYTAKQRVCIYNSVGCIFIPAYLIHVCFCVLLTVLYM